MDKLFLRKNLLYISIIVFLFFLDRFTKIYILNYVEDNGSINIYVNQFLNLILVWNTGIGFGLLSSHGTIFYNFITLIIIFINIIIIYLIIKTNDYRIYFLLLILGGSLGNLFDRIYYFAVPDFIDINYKGFHWFIFNVADIFISIGIICLITSELFFFNKIKK
jgi:lipoprotein signal peptidase|tara:strand:- start:299 stop:790 length:492 start_codon:yes stop_codon:yes gene_type:complete